MITVRLVGGLGNQMFQYATGLSLACRNGDTLALDTGEYSFTRASETHREFGLLDFEISASPLPAELAALMRNPHGLRSRLHRFVSRKLLRRFFSDWHPEVLEWRGDIYLDGYFQSSRYFAEIDDRIRREYTLSGSLKAGISEHHNLIRRLGNSVFIHFRRGDYVNDANVARIHNVCSTLYYRNAISLIRSTIQDAHFVVFSDDINWVKSQFPELASAIFMSEKTTTDGRRLRPAEELDLMTSCQHAVIANSTFSWWGAYLSKNPDGMVVAPARWTNEPKSTHPNILPSRWHTIAP